MPRESIHYEGRLIDLPVRTIPGGGWLEWAATWRGPDGTRHPVESLAASCEGAQVEVEHQGGRFWRVTVKPGSTAALASPRRGRGRRLPSMSTPKVTVLAFGNVDGHLLPIARQEVVV